MNRIILREAVSQMQQQSNMLTNIPPETVVSPLIPEYQNLRKSLSFVTFYGPSVFALLLQHIAVTLGALSLVRERLPADNACRELVSEAERAGLRAADLTGQLLGFARGKSLNLQPIRVDRAIADTLRRQLAGGAGPCMRRHDTTVFLCCSSSV